MLQDTFYRYLFDMMPVAAAVVLDGKFVQINPAAALLLEAGQEQDVVGHSVREFVHLLDQTRSHIRLTRPGAGWQNAPAQFRICTAKGNFRMAIMISSPIVFNEQDAMLLLGMDVTEHSKMEEELRVSELNFRRLFENMQDVYYRTDANGTVRMIGPGVRRVLGYEPDEVVGKNAESYYPHPADRDALKKAILNEGKVTDFPGQMVRKDGRIIDISINSQALFDEQGQFAGVEGLYRDVTQSKMLERELKRLATTDSLTGIANRRAFLEQAEYVFKTSQRYQTPITLLMLDLDFFKSINDRHGHLSGDRVLNQFAEAVKLELRDSDLFGRIGGEEFGILLQQSNQSDAIQAAERIRKRVESMRVTVASGDALAVTVSIGISANHQDDIRLGNMLERADKALYRAKSNGRNRVVYEP